jgi:hypothetical protein
MNEELSVTNMTDILLHSIHNETPIHDMLRSPSEKRSYPKTNKTIAACMIVMDDSIRLSEWIA